MKTKDLVVGNEYKIRFSFNQGYNYNITRKLFSGVGKLHKIREGCSNKLHEFILVTYEAGLVIPTKNIKTIDKNGKKAAIVYCTSNGILLPSSSKQIDLVPDWTETAQKLLVNENLKESIDSVVVMLGGLGVKSHIDEGKLVVAPVDTIKLGELLKPVFLHYSEDLLGD